MGEVCVCVWGGGGGLRYRHGLPARCRRVRTQSDILHGTTREPNKGNLYTLLKG